MKDISRAVETLPLPTERIMGKFLMPNDAKLGLVIGLGLVIALAVIYFRGDGGNRNEESAATAVKPAATHRRPSPRGQSRPTKARPAVQTEGGESSESPSGTEAEVSDREP
jgi:hypothetical protein